MIGLRKLQFREERGKNCAYNGIGCMDMGRTGDGALRSPGPHREEGVRVMSVTVGGLSSLKKNDG